MRMDLYKHFLYSNMRDTVIIVEEVKSHKPQFPRYDIMLPWVVLRSRHSNTTLFTKRAEWKILRMVEEEM